MTESFPFHDALFLLGEGFKIKRVDWVDGQHIKVDHGDLVIINPKFSTNPAGTIWWPSSADMFRHLWTVFES